MKTQDPEPRRRRFVRTAEAAGPAGQRPSRSAADRCGFRISLAEWSLHRAIQSGVLTNLEFPHVAQEHFGVEGVEFVNWMWKAPTQRYLQQLRRNIRNAGVEAVLIMCDLEGPLGSPDPGERAKAVENHYKWVDAAAELDCFAIRANMRPGRWRPSGPDELRSFIGYAAESFRRLCEYARKARVDVLIENHGGPSSNPDVVVRLVHEVNMSNFGTLPDFGNFPAGADRYDAVRRMMPFAGDVSFKCHDFAPEPEFRETHLDMDRMMKIVLDSGYRGWIGIEYSGKRLNEFEGIQAAKRYLDHFLDSLVPC